MLRCIHNTKKKNTSIMILDKFKTMACPDITYGVCTVCGKSFEFVNKTRKEVPFDVDDGRNENKAE